MTLHDAICKAAGWQAYCSRCGGKMKRLIGLSALGGGGSYCPNPKCKEPEVEKDPEEFNRPYGG